MTKPVNLPDEGGDMSELRNRSLRGPLVAILTAMLAVWSGSASAASDQEVQQLEARVAELEALVRQLANGQNMQRQELATFDLVQWRAQLTTLPDGTGSITQAVDGVTGQVTHSITVFWNEERDPSAVGTGCDPNDKTDLRCFQLTM